MDNSKPKRQLTPEQLGKIAKEGAKRAEKLGIKETDVPDLVHKARKNKKK